jgi:S1-C subfamily serine protease
MFTAKVLGIAFLVLAIAIKAPQLHGDYIRNKVGSQVVMLTEKSGRSGGTGFAIKTPSGQVLTLTNAHVCSLADDKGTVYARVEGRRTIPLKVIESYDKADLCLVSKMPGTTGLSVAGSVAVGEELGLVGHPALLPLTLTKGQLLGYGEVAVLMDNLPCEEDVGMYKTIDTPFGPLCIAITNAAFTNIPAFGGSSGSPVINIWGNLTGVLYAGDESVNWGILVKLTAVKDFIKNY